MSKEKFERGEIRRITFDIVYPSGELKTVKMNIHNGADWEKAGLIVFNEQLIDDIVMPGLVACKGKEAAESAKTKWNTKNVELPYKPAMLIIESDGEVHERCGGHHGELIHGAH